VRGLLVLAQLIVFFPVISNLVLELLEPPLCSTVHLLSVPAWPDELSGSVLHSLQFCCSAILLCDRLFVVNFYYYHSQLGGAHKKVGSNLIISLCKIAIQNHNIHMVVGQFQSSPKSQTNFYVLLKLLVIVVLPAGVVGSIPKWSCLP
jgi:hypothetical protein